MLEISRKKILKELEVLENRKNEMKHMLHHLFRFPWYKWAWKFFNNTTDKIQLLCAANQISKSSTQIRKCIHWATDKSIWPKLWPYAEPNMFWYLYPSKDIATAEFKKKWMQFMPDNEMREDPIYGWKVVYDGKHISHIDFNSGVTVYFKTYMQNASTLQSGSVFAIFCDEELPEHIYDELMFRIGGTGGYFHMVFTATLGQELWYRAMEMMGHEREFLPDAFKQVVSMYDCLEYMDGSPSPWTVERIKEIEQRCKSPAEINRRVHGRFVKTEGRIIHAFDPTTGYVKPFKIPSYWSRYVGVDIGSGGETGHPSAIAFVAVNPECTEGYVYKGWRGDGISTTSGDVYNKYLELVEPGESFINRVYDFSAVDFGITAQRNGDPFNKANKSNDQGHDLINILLKNKMLRLFDDFEIRKLGSEWITMLENTSKTKRKDDFSDACRYAVIEIPWDLSKVVPDDGKVIVQDDRLPDNLDECILINFEAQRNGTYVSSSMAEEQAQDWGELESDIMEMNELYGN